MCRITRSRHGEAQDMKARPFVLVLKFTSLISNLRSNRTERYHSLGYAITSVLSALIITLLSTSKFPSAGIDFSTH